MSKNRKKLRDSTRLKFIPVVDDRIYHETAELFDDPFIALSMKGGRLHLYVSLGIDEWADQSFSVDKLVEYEIDSLEGDPDDGAKERLQMADEFQRLADKLRHGPNKTRAIAGKKRRTNG